MANTNTTLKGFVLMATLGASSTNIALPYAAEPIDIQNSIPNYSNIADVSVLYSYKFNNMSQAKVLIDFSVKLAQNCKNIDPEYTDIVNDHFWHLI